MKNSIRTKITLMMVMFSTAIVAGSWIICNYLIEGVFIINVKRNLETTYASCNAMFNQGHKGFNNEGELYGRISNPTEAIVMILDNQNKKIYTSINDQGQMMTSLNSMIDAIRNSGEFAAEPGTYVINKNHDPVINADYYDLVGTLDNGFTIILRSPSARIESMMQVVTKVFIYISVGLIVFGSAFMLIFSNIFAAPIKRLTHAAKRMTMLDFNVKVPINSNDEIGELGTYMNAMSKKLEGTISEIKLANIRLEKDIEEKKQIDEIRKEFLSHVSHELKTPIALIQGYAEGLKDNVYDDPETQEFYIDVIIDEAQKMNIMVKKLLTLNEIEFGDNPLNIERFELVGFINDIISASKILLDEMNVNIEFDNEEPIYVWADEYMIEEVFTNYLTNAIHYVCNGGVIKVFIENNGNDVRVNVYNQGNNIAEEDLDKLFIKFYKADKARTREYGGNGIGLSIVAAAMEAHGKPYGVYNVDDGVVFYFNLDANMLDDNLI